MNARTVLFALVAVAALILPKVIYPVLAMDILCFALLALALDLLFGFAGLLSFGQAMFLGGSAYTTAILVQNYHLDGALAILAGVLYATVLACVVGAIVVRRSGIYFAMITLAIAQIEYFAAINWSSFTGGENGLPMTTRGTLFGVSVSNDVAFYYVIFVAVAMSFWLVIRLTNSPFGTVLSAIRQNETRAVALGYRVHRYKLAAFVIAGALSGLAGALYALGNRLAGLEMCDWHTSGAVVMMTVLGGSGTIVGPAIGAAVYELLNYFVSSTAIGRETDLVIGIVFAVCILWFRQGIAGGVLSASWRKTST
ncbi:MAG TPA: branched-chain amino acid ABC transporter permease [Candidatus Acidoferrales bacterium]|nr:branched-chain amino acid ABC transporter permease [Candidatus Acidoferrales bacterium]